MKIDINSDLGEGYGPWKMGDDEALLGIVSSANVACGYHAGDPMIMMATARAAKMNNVDLGAHVSYPDRAGFGRRPIPMRHGELECHILYQLGAMDALARAAGHRVTHINAHGALGNQVCADRDLAETLARAARTFDRNIALLVLSGTELEAAAQRAGLKTYNLFLADRAYQKNGQLVPRSVSGAVIKEDAAVLERVRRILDDRTIIAHDGTAIKVAVDSILVHSDTPGAVRLAQAIRSEIIRAGATVAPLSQLK